MKVGIEKFDSYNGYEFKVVLNEYGIRSGYVKIHHDNKNWAIDYFNVRNKYGIPISCHGSLNYSGFDVYGCYWIGFSCDHYNDMPDTNAVKEHFSNNCNNNMYNENNIFATVKSVDFVENECKNIIDQLN